MTDERTDLVIHIGLRKTGSSALQELLAKNADMLRDHGLDYPARLTRFPAHQELAWCLYDTPPDYAALDHSREEVYSHYEAAIEDNRRRGMTTLLSSEDLSLLSFDFSALSFIKKRFDRFSPRIVMVKRHPLEFHISNYKHAVFASREIRSFEDFTFRSEEIAYASSRLVSRVWRSAFGQNNVTEMNYASLISSDDGILSQFLDSVFNIRTDQQTPDHRSNQSLSNEMTINALELNRSDLSDVEVQERKRHMKLAQGDSDRTTFLRRFLGREQLAVLMKIHQINEF